MSLRSRVQSVLSVLPAPVRKLVVLIIGVTVLLVGVAMIVLPGPASLILPLGLAILSIEFVWARVLLNKARSVARQAAAKVGLTRNTPSPPP